MVAGTGSDGRASFGGPPDRRTVRIPIPGGVVVATVAGHGEPVLLVHGLGGTRHTWERVTDTLARTHTVIAADLPGHGDSEAPAGDYSLGAHAAALRDVLVWLGHGSASLVGHSLGGGVGLQFAYQFPERTRRLALVSSGGLGSEVTPVLRAATLPGAGRVTALLARLPETVVRRLLSASGALGQTAPQDVVPLAAGIRGLADARPRRAFLRTARAVIDWRGQTVSALRQLGLLTDVPLLVVWGDADRTIPPAHHRDVAAQLPHARSVELTGVGHYPQETAPQRLLPPLVSFLSGTRSATYQESRWRDLLTRPAAPTDLRESAATTTAVTRR